MRDGGLDQRDFMRRGALHEHRRWKTMLVSNRDNLRPLPRFVFPTQVPPFLAGAKLPSMNASCTSS
jgi:hypothetical protein